MRAEPEEAIIYDTNLHDPDKAQRLIDAILDSGRTVRIRYVHRAFEEAVKANLIRAKEEGRLSPAQDIARLHYQARKTIEILLANNLGRPGVEFDLRLNDGEFRTLTPDELRALPRPSLDELVRKAHRVADALSLASGSGGPASAEAIALFRGRTQDEWLINGP